MGKIMIQHSTTTMQTRQQAEKLQIIQDLERELYDTPSMDPSIFFDTKKLLESIRKELNPVEERKDVVSVITWLNI